MPFIQVRGAPLYYALTAGKVDGTASSTNEATAIVFIHGLGSSSSFYAPVIPALAEQGFTCLALDSYGSCQSKNNGEFRSIKEMSEDVLAVMSKLDIPAKNAVLVGHSMGCLVVSEMASSSQVAGTVLIGPIRPSPGVAEVFKKRIETVNSLGMEPMADTIPSAATGSSCSSTQRGFIRALLLSQTPEGYTASCKAIAEATVPDYSAITCPLLVLAGEEDKTAPVEVGRDVLESWNSKKKQIEVLGGVGHWHCIEKADVVGKHVSEFLKQVS